MPIHSTAHAACMDTTGVGGFVACRLYLAGLSGKFKPWSMHDIKNAKPVCLHPSLSLYGSRCFSFSTSLQRDIFFFSFAFFGFALRIVSYSSRLVYLQTMNFIGVHWIRFAYSAKKRNSGGRGKGANYQKPKQTTRKMKIQRRKKDPDLKRRNPFGNGLATVSLWPESLSYWTINLWQEIKSHASTKHNKKNPTAEFPPPPPTDENSLGNLPLKNDGHIFFSLH